MSLDLFKDILPTITTNKTYVFDQPEAEKSYVPFVINRALSYHSDCVFMANAMNEAASLDKKLQYDFLYGMVRRYKRKYQAWQKIALPAHIDLVKEYYHVSTPKAMEMLKLLSKEQLAEMKQKLDKGGIRKKSTPDK